MPSIQDRVALLLAIKEPGKMVSPEHLHDKITRDLRHLGLEAPSGEGFLTILSEMVEKGLAKEMHGNFGPAAECDPHVGRLLAEVGIGMNRSYSLVWKATRYYPRVAEMIIPFLRGRPVSAVKIFSGKKDPINEVDPIFMRYSKLKPKPKHLTVEDRETLVNLVYDHCIDFIPYVHTFDFNIPDRFVIDLDAGGELKARPEALNVVGVVALAIVEILEECGVRPIVKFSGSRGFQIWSSIDRGALGESADQFGKFRELAVKIRRKAEPTVRDRMKRLYPELLSEDRPITTSRVAHKEERAFQVLVDWSSMKPAGDARAPFSIHYRTGLVSLPLRKNDIEGFGPELAEPMRVLANLDQYRWANALETSFPSGWIREALA